MGESLAQLVADEQWDAIGDYIDQLPGTSHTKAAMLDDPDYAERILDGEDPASVWTPPVTQWGLLESMVAQLISGVAGVQSAVIAGAGGNPAPHKPFPRPVTGVDKARERREHEGASAILEMAGFNPADYL